MMENTENESTDTKCIKKEWGSYKVLDEGPGYKVKRIAILPERSIELHYHKKRHEDCIIGLYYHNRETYCPISK